jgi:GMP synthase (glutamine-hydrolysing)
VRVQGEVTPGRVEIVRKATKIVEDGMKNVKSFQNLAILLSDKATGIKDGKRLFGGIIVIRSVMSKDAMTAKATNVPWNALKKVESKILREIPEVTHVVYSLTDKPPATIEFQ